MYFAAGYLVSSSGITIAMMSGQNVATVNCASDCSSFQGAPIYISGNANPFLNGIWWTCPSADVTFTCTATSTQLQFKSPVSSPPTNYGGIIWAPDYWPIVMPFAVQHNATSIEVYECDLDYAFGAYPNNTTTTWVLDETGLTGGCAAWGLLGQDVGYQNSASDTQNGQPFATSVRTGNSVLSNGASQF
jgi:hypothetical protein